MKRDRFGHVRDVVDGLITKWEQGAVKKGNLVQEAWAASVEESIKGHARPVSFKKGVLMVIVDDSNWLYKLTMEKKGIIEKFNEHYTGRKKAADIRFRVGSTEE